jgi:hypothetical protein
MTKHEKIARAVKYTAFDTKKDPANVEHVNFYLGIGEKLTQEQLDDYHAAAARLMVGDPAPEAEATETEPWLVAEPEAVAEPGADAEAVGAALDTLHQAPEPFAADERYDPEAARNRAFAADRNLGECRLAVARAKDAESASRRKLAAAVTQFQIATATKRPTQSEFFKQHAIEQNEIRRKIAAGEMPGPVRRNTAIGRSAVDRAAFYQKGGNPAGGGRAYARGALPASHKGAPNYDPRRGPVAKPPSAR